MMAILWRNSKLWDTSFRGYHTRLRFPTQPNGLRSNRLDKHPEEWYPIHPK